jgi:hypothetical protein
MNDNIDKKVSEIMEYFSDNLEEYSSAKELKISKMINELIDIVQDETAKDLY